MEFITGRTMTVTRVFAILMAIGVVASGIYGMTKAGPHLINETAGTIDTLKVSLITSHDHYASLQPKI